MLSSVFRLLSLSFPSSLKQINKNLLKLHGELKWEVMYFRLGVDYINAFFTAICALRPTFGSQKASQKFGVEHK